MLQFKRPDYSLIDDSKLVDLLKGCLNKDPNKRITLDQLMVWFYSIDSRLAH